MAVLDTGSSWDRHGRGLSCIAAAFMALLRKGSGIGDPHFEGPAVQARRYQSFQGIMDATLHSVWSWRRHVCKACCTKPPHFGHSPLTENSSSVAVQAGD